jgi:hypothetical protein
LTTKKYKFAKPLSDLYTLKELIMSFYPLLSKKKPNSQSFMLQITGLCSQAYLHGFDYKIYAGRFPNGTSSISSFELLGLGHPHSMLTSTAIAFIIHQQTVFHSL